LVLLEDEMREVCDEVFVTTNDGSYGIEGFVTHALAKILEKEQVGAILAIGPVPMMQAVSNMTKPLQIPTFVSLNAIMVDGTGMCGACRVTVGGQTKFACYDGPDFDGHTVNYEELILRQKMYKTQEAQAMDLFCRLEEQLHAKVR
jgi:ferredoxin--NADP+ reductase